MDDRVPKKDGGRQSLHVLLGEEAVYTRDCIQVTYFVIVYDGFPEQLDKVVDIRQQLVLVCAVVGQVVYEGVLHLVEEGVWDFEMLLNQLGEEGEKVQRVCGLLVEVVFLVCEDLVDAFNV